MAGDETGDGDVIHVRCSGDLKRLVDTAAAANGLSTSEFVRERMRAAATDELTPERVNELRKTSVDA